MPLSQAFSRMTKAQDLYKFRVGVCRGTERIMDEG